MSQSLDDFVHEVKSEIEKFEAAYREKAASNPEHYPLTLPDDNAGLWLEFFVNYMEGGGV